MRERENLSHDFFSLVMGPALDVRSYSGCIIGGVVQVIQNKSTWDIPEVDDVDDQQLNMLEIIVEYRVDEHIEDDTLCRLDALILQWWKDRFNMSFPIGVDKTIALFDFDVDMFTNARGTSSMGDTSDTSHSSSSTLRRRPHSRNLIGVLTLDTFSLCFLKWVDVTPGERRVTALRRILKERTTAIIKKFSDLEQERVNPLPRLKKHVEYQNFLCNHYATRRSLTTTIADPSRFYNDNTSSLNNEDIQSIKWSCYEKHTLGVASFFRRRSWMCISLSSSYEKEMHTMEVTQLKDHLDKVTELHERAMEESNRKHKENDRLVEEMRKMIEKLTLAHRGPRFHCGQEASRTGVRGP
ncbi:(R)-mandelonitrile lyase 1-like [Cucumis melo var. makuwa]|uniref:(R)-mandelonitrile lyase 1-like n=1 Tax=Cucumis melo var. makuwa TaxID=1194695 RepID=A0A5D3DWJ3_CUCMM|nr:(R)-mandelonitrile lyase 1-like [Cucumis melo var. makuwa]